MTDTYCPTCGEPWDLDEHKIIREMKRTHRCPCCPKDLPTDARLPDKLMEMLFGDDCDDGDPFAWM